jgi:hypothetical protein
MIWAQLFKSPKLYLNEFFILATFLSYIEFINLNLQFLGVKFLYSKAPFCFFLHIGRFFHKMFGHTAAIAPETPGRGSIPPKVADPIRII